MKTTHFSTPRRAVLAGAALALAACAGPSPGPGAAPASYFLSVQDGRAGMADGAPLVRDAADSLAVVEVAGGRMRVVHQIAMPTSLVGPPSSIAMAPGGRSALVTASTRRDPANAAQVVPYDLVSVMALDSSGRDAPRVAASLNTGAGAAGVSINRAGTLALVANRVEGSVSLLTIEREQVRVAGKVRWATNPVRRMPPSHPTVAVRWSAATATTASPFWRSTVSLSCLSRAA